MKGALAEVGDFKIGGRIINKVRFMDDTVIIAKTQEELPAAVNLYCSLISSLCMGSIRIQHVRNLGSYNT